MKLNYPKLAIIFLLLLFTIGTVTAANVSANFTANITSAVTPPLTVRFTDASTCDPACTDWSWDLNGDGSIDSVLQNVTYTFSSSGDFSPKLFVSNGYATGTKIRFHYIEVGGAFTGVTPTQPVVTWGSPYHNASSGNTSFSFVMNTQVDLPNSSIMKYWLQDFLVTKNFSIVKFSYGIMHPIMNIFGFWIYLIIWLLYLFAVWIRSQSTTLPLIVGFLSAGAFGILFPAESWPVVIVFFVICGTIAFLKVVKE